MVLVAAAVCSALWCNGEGRCDGRTQAKIAEGATEGASEGGDGDEEDVRND